MIMRVESWAEAVEGERPIKDRNDLAVAMMNNLGKNLSDLKRAKESLI